MATKRYTFQEAAAFLQIDLSSLSRKIRLHELRPHWSREGSTIAESELLRYQGLCSVDTAVEKLYQKMRKSSKEVTPSQAAEILQDSISRSVKKITVLVGGVAYLKRTDLPQLLGESTTAITPKKKEVRKYYPRQEVLAYFTDKMKERGFPYFVFHKNFRNPISHLLQELRGSTKSTGMAPYQLNNVHAKVEELIERFYDPRRYTPLQEAAEYLKRTVMAVDDRAFIARRSIFNLKESFLKAIHQNKLPAKQYLNPANGRLEWCLERGQLERMVEDYLKQLEARTSEKEAYQRRQEAVALINSLRREVAAQFSIRLPEKLFLSQPKGNYATINYTEEDGYGSKLKSSAAD